MGFSVRSLRILANGNDLAAFSNSELSIVPNAAICNELRIFDVTILFGLHATSAAGTAGGRNRCIHQLQLISTDAVAAVFSARAAGDGQRGALLALDRQLAFTRCYSSRPIIAAVAAGQLILAIQLQSYAALAGNSHSALVCIPCIHLQVTEDDLQSLGRAIEDTYHITGGGLSLFGNGGGGVGVPVGLLLSGLFLPSLLLDNRLGFELGGLLLGFGVILAVLDHLIGGLFGLFVLLRLLGFGGLLLVLLLLVLLLLVLRVQQLQRAGLFGLLLVLSGGVLGLPLALGLGLAGLLCLSGLFDLRGVLVSVLLCCVQAFGGRGLGVVAGDGDIITLFAVAEIFRLISAANHDGHFCAAVIVCLRDFNIAVHLRHIDVETGRSRHCRRRHRHAERQHSCRRALHRFP